VTPPPGAGPWTWAEPPLTWTQLRDLELARVQDAADGWGRASNRADAARDRIEKHLMVNLAESQEGEAAGAALARLRVLGGDCQYAYTECGLVRTALNSLADELGGPQRALRSALDDAEGLRFTVHDDGSVSYPAAGEQPATHEQLAGGTAVGRGPLAVPSRLPGPHGPSAGPSGATRANPNAAKAQDIADRIECALREARAVDAQYTSALSRLTAKDGLRVPDAMWKDAYGDATAVRALAGDYLERAVPLAATPVERAAWWARLTREQREQYLAVYPDVIGNLDGIPADIRDRANRDNLRLLIGKLAGRHDDRSRTQLAGLREIDRALGAGGEPPMYLLGIGDEGNGRAIVSYGNPDTARNVSAYVPGLGTALDREFATNDLKRARDTALGARGYDPSAASIVWLGYDAPQGADVGGIADAEKGGVAYRDFMGGLVATNQHVNAHFTAIGHSYGSRTVGAATQHAGGIPGVDDIILVGSPGVGVDKAEDLGVGKDHVFVGAAQNDLVTKLPSKTQVWAASAAGIAMGPLGPVGALIGGEAADPEGDELWFGRDPASREFGARRFEVADGPPPFSGGSAVPAHSNYFDPVRDAQSAENISLIVSGNSGEIRTEKWR
jgi:Alpha/beta hydrolase